MNSSLNLRDWTSVYEAAWYTYGAFMTKNSIVADNSNGANGLRWFLAIWLFYGFLITCVYSGNLTAFLTQPGTDQPIDTLTGVIDSGLPWGMVSTPGSQSPACPGAW